MKIVISLACTRQHQTHLDLLLQAALVLHLNLLTAGGKLGAAGIMQQQQSVQQQWLGRPLARLDMTICIQLQSAYSCLQDMLFDCISFCITTTCSILLGED